MKAVKIYNEVNRFVIDWSINSLCTYHCSYCPDDLHRGVNFIKSKAEDYDIVKNFLEKLAQQLKGKSVHIFLNGGEPTIHPCLELIIDFCNNMGWCLYVNTNGSRSLEWWRDYAHKIYKVTISYHPETADEEIFDKIEYIKTRTNLGVFVLMYPPLWQKSVDAFNRLISVSDLTLEPSRVFNRQNDRNEQSYNYSDDQLEWLTRHSGMGIRGGSFAPPGNNYFGKTFIQYDAGVVDTLDEVEYVNALKNQFSGWECDMGLTHIMINPRGEIKKSACKQAKTIGTIANFQGLVLDDQPEICRVKYCMCTLDVLISKRTYA